MSSQESPSSSPVNRQPVDEKLSETEAQRLVEMIAEVEREEAAAIDIEGKSSLDDERPGSA